MYGLYHFIFTNKCQIVRIMSEVSARKNIIFFILTTKANFCMSIIKKSVVEMKFIPNYIRLIVVSVDN